MEIKGARVLLTGGSAGIGASLAPMLAERGATLALCGRDQAKLAGVADQCRELGAEVHTHRVELADPVAAETFTCTR